MIVRSLDANGDWTYGAGLNNYKSNKIAVEQNIQTRLSSFLGNCFFDLGAGVNWFVFLGGSKDPISLNLAISAVILNTAYVLTLSQSSLNFNTVTRQISINYQVTTSFGVITGVVTLPTNYLTTEDENPIITESGENIIV